MSLKQNLTILHKLSKYQHTPVENFIELSLRPTHSFDNFLPLSISSGIQAMSVSLTYYQ
jgi:hypothetical protein